MAVTGIGWPFGDGTIFKMVAGIPAGLPTGVLSGVGLNVRVDVDDVGHTTSARALTGVKVTGDDKGGGERGVLETDDEGGG